MSNRPKPHYQCFTCLRRLGYGYDRTARQFGITKHRVAKWFAYHKPDCERPATSKAAWKKRESKPRHPRIVKPYTKMDWPAKWERTFKPKTQFQLRKYLRSKLWQWFKRGLHPNTTPILIGCNRAELEAHISAKFKPGMTLDNYTLAWEFDHIKPLAKFDLRTQWREAFHFTNLQPLTPHENAVKAAS